MYEKQQRNKPETKLQQQFEIIEIQENNTSQFSVSQILSSINSTCISSIRKINQVATNLAYNARHSSCPFINRKQIIIKEDGEPAFLLGKKYLPGSQQLFQEAFHSIIWICYRSEQQDKFGDVGWGCMIRVCQMVLAEALKRSVPQKHNSQIIKQFAATNQALFSFDKICSQGNIMKRWTSSPQIMIVIQNLMKKQSKYKLKVQMYNIQISIDDIQPQQNYPLLMVVGNRLGLKKIQQRLVDHIKQILQHKNSVGLISAIGGQAIYVVGYYEDQFITLDPHYVQSEAEGQKIYFNKVARGVTLQKMVSSVGFCFYFQNKSQHQEWLQDFAQSYHYHSPNVAIQCDQQFCKKIYQQRHPKILNQIEDDQFQVLQ